MSPNGAGELRPRVQSPLQHTLIAFHVLLLVSGFVLLGIAVWVRFDPARAFLLRLVHFSETTPFLVLAIYLMLGTSLLIFLAVGIGVAASWHQERCLLSGFISSLMLLVLFKMGILLLLLFSHLKFSDEITVTRYLSTIAQNRYNRDKWTAPLMDSIQYYHKCCGGNGAHDYAQSFWYMTNTERGTPSFVPLSCCRQTQNARAWHLQPIDSLCVQFEYGSRAFNDSVNWTGCGGPTFRHLNWLLHLLAAFAIGMVGLDAAGLFLALKCLHQVWTFYSSISHNTWYKF